MGYNQFAYCFNNPVKFDDSEGAWPRWAETVVKVASAAIAVTAAVVTITAVSAFTAGTGTIAAVYGSTIFLGAALSGINGGVANEANGNSYINGYLGGAAGGTIQGFLSKSTIGTIFGGGSGVAVGTAITGIMNNIDPDSANLSVSEIALNSLSSGGKGLVTSTLTAGIGYASNMAVANGGAYGLMPTYTYGFGEAVKIFGSWMDDALVYLWE